MFDESNNRDMNKSKKRAKSDMYSSLTTTQIFMWIGLTVKMSFDRPGVFGFYSYDDDDDDDYYYSYLILFSQHK